VLAHAHAVEGVLPLVPHLGDTFDGAQRGAHELAVVADRAIPALFKLKSRILAQKTNI
jgi:hypothetical protein